MNPICHARMVGSARLGVCYQLVSNGCSCYKNNETACNRSDTLRLRDSGRGQENARTVASGACRRSNLCASPHMLPGEPSQTARTMTASEGNLPAITMPAAKPTGGRWPRDDLTAWLLVAPAVVSIVMLFVVPIGYVLL